MAAETCPIAGNHAITNLICSVLSREFLSIFMVIYLPTILVDTIDQATNYWASRGVSRDTELGNE